MAIQMPIVPDDIKEYLELVDCSDFNEEAYFKTSDMMEIYDDILKMQEVSYKLHERNLSFLNSTLLYGVPGTGKTTFAKYLAYKQNKPLAYIMFSKLMDGILGKTAANISKIFRFMANTECVFLLDEVDSIAIKRGTESSATGGELSRITITLMQEMDYYRIHKLSSLLIACTNRADILDAALLSRFSIKHEVKGLRNDDKERYLRLVLDRASIPCDEDTIEDYCAENSILTQRSIEADVVRCAAAWIADGEVEGTFKLNHIREDY